MMSFKMARCNEPRMLRLPESSGVAKTLDAMLTDLYNIQSNTLGTRRNGLKQAFHDCKIHNIIHYHQAFVLNL